MALQKKDKQSKKEKKYFEFIPEEISLKDDAYHGSEALSFTEWWYFDAELDNDYSIQMHLRIGSLLKNSIVLFFKKFEIYKDKKLLTSKRKVHLKKHVYVSYNTPLVKINNKEVIKGYIDEKTGKWIYDINFEIEDAGIFLKFEGTGNGYKGVVGKPINKKGTTKQGKWAVILAFANVSGKIKIKNEEIKVKGYGYHDHNWDMRGTVITNYGWLWGKIYTKEHTIVWSKVFKTKNISSNLLIISKKNEGYLNIKSDDIDFIIDEYRKEKNRIIPHHFHLNANNEKIKLEIDMKAENIHHQKVFGFINYYRFHMKCIGYVTIDSKKEEINDILISEFLRFG